MHLKRKTFIILSILVVISIILVLRHKFRNYEYKRSGRSQIEKFILSDGTIFKPIRKDTIIVYDYDFHKCSMDNRDFIDKKYTRNKIESTLKSLGFRHIIYASTDYISVNGGQPISINSGGTLYPNYPTYSLHIWEEILISNRILITISESYSNIDTGIDVNLVLQWNGSAFKIAEEKAEIIELPFRENPEKKGNFYSINLPVTKISYPYYKTKYLLSKYNILFSPEIKSDSFIYSYGWDVMMRDSISPIFKIKFYGYANTTTLQAVGAYYDRNRNNIYGDTSTYLPEKRTAQYKTLIFYIEEQIYKFGKIDSIYNLGISEAKKGDYAKSNVHFTQLLKIRPQWVIKMLNINSKIGINYYHQNKLDLARDFLLKEMKLSEEYTLMSCDADTYKYLSMYYKSVNQNEMAEKYNKEYELKKR
jgi:hypothetical protein